MITESRFLKGTHLNLDFSIDGYQYLQTPTESSAGGSLLYISNCHIFHPRSDLDNLMYQAKYLESVFAKIVVPNKSNIIVGTIYRHPGMSMEVFNQEFLAPFLHKIALEKKEDNPA